MSHNSPPSFDAIFHAQQSQTPRRSSSSSFTSMTQATYETPYSHQLGTTIHDEPGSLSHRESSTSLRNRNRDEPAARLHEGMRGVSMSDSQAVGGPSRIDSLPFDPESATLIATAPRGGKGERRNIGEIMYSPTAQYPTFAHQQQQQQTTLDDWPNPEDQYAQYISVPTSNAFPNMASPFPESPYIPITSQGEENVMFDPNHMYSNGQNGIQDGSWGAEFYNQEMTADLTSPWNAMGKDQVMDMSTAQGVDVQQQQLQEELERIISNSAIDSRPTSPFHSLTQVSQTPYPDHNLSPYQAQQFQRPISPYESHNVTFHRPSPPHSASLRKSPSPHPPSPFTKPQSPPALIIPNHSPSPKLPPIVTTQAPVNGNGGVLPPRQGAMMGMGGGSGGLLPPVNPALEHLTGMGGISPIAPSADGPQIYIQPSTPISGLKDGRGIWEAALRKAGNQSQTSQQSQNTISNGYNVPPPASHSLSRPSSNEHLQQANGQQIDGQKGAIDYHQLFSQWSQQQNLFPGLNPNASNTARQRSKSESSRTTSPAEVFNREAFIQAMTQAAQQQQMQINMGQTQPRSHVDNWRTALIGDKQQDGGPTLDPRNLPGQDATNYQNPKQAQNHLDFSSQLAQLQAKRHRSPGLDTELNTGSFKYQPGEMSPTSMAFYQSLGLNPTTPSQISGTSSAPYHQSTFNIPTQAPPQPDWANFNPNIWPQTAGPAMQSFLSPDMGGLGPRRKSYTEGSTLHPAMGAGTPGYGVEFTSVSAGMGGKIRGISAGLGMGHRRGVKSEDFGRGGTGWGVGTGGSTADFLDSITANDGTLLPPTRGRSSSHSRHSSASSVRSVSPSLSISSQGSSYGGYSPGAELLEVGDSSLLPTRGTGRGRGRGRITKMKVTSAATEVASSNRRTNDGVFKCPVPGCGSTFTRHFNLKGHLRSHNDERPYKCLYEGCPKAEVGFARQHDCKRHMLLHEGLRPFECEGCGKNFARLDALTRHHKSEQGQECAQTHPLPLNPDGTPMSESQYKAYLTQRRSGGLLVPSTLERLPGSDWGSGEEDDLGTGSGMEDYDRF